MAAGIDALTTGELNRLDGYARLRLNGVPDPQRKGRDYEDLVQHAITATLDGSRKWRKTVPFVHHLLGVVRSTSNHWAESAHPDLAVPASVLAIEAENGEVLDPVEGAAFPAPDTERAAIARERLSKVREHFSDDTLISLIIDAFVEGYTTGDLAAVLGEPQKDIEAAVRKMRRQANAHFPDWGTP